MKFLVDRKYGTMESAVKASRKIWVYYLNKSAIHAQKDALFFIINQVQFR